ncbi:MAG: LysE family transporter [Actinomycetota bacterium]|nr:LysE family transporter [Actinomycetota bacterium]
MLAGIFFSSFLIGLSGALLPGPLLTVAVSESYKKGIIAGPLIVIGHAIPEFVLAALLAASFGIEKILKNDIVVGALGIAGGTFLLIMGINMLYETSKGISLDLQSESGFHYRPFLAGILVSISNPGWIVWWATIGARYILASLEYGIKGLAFFYAGHILADFTWYTFLSFLVSRGRRHLSEKFYRWLILGASLLVLVFSIFFVVNGIQKIFH